MRGTSLKEDFNMKENIFKTFKISKVMKESSDITVDTSLCDCIQSNSCRFREVKTDGVILKRFTNGEDKEPGILVGKEEKVIGSTVTIVDDITTNSGHFPTLNSRKVYSEKWVTPKDIERISEKCKDGDINNDMSNNSITIDGKRHALVVIHPNIFGEIMPLDKGFDEDVILKTDGQKFAVDGRIYVRNASYIIRIRCEERYKRPRKILHSIYIDFDRANAKTLKDIRDDWHIGNYEAKKKFQIT